jgi:hypothetical protein
MISRGFRYGILVSCAFHGITAALFTFSFGRVLPAPSVTETHFLGQLLNSWDIVPEMAAATGMVRTREGVDALLPAAKSRARAVPEQLPFAALKPGRAVVIVPEKGSAAFHQVPFPVRVEPVITFYPHLSPNILLYFKDRQNIHMELGYMMELRQGRPKVQVRRRVSSGNLEADLLSMRYIGRSLMLHQVYLEPSHWYRAKIDLAVGRAGEKGNAGH